MSEPGKFDSEKFRDELRDHIYQNTYDKMKAKSLRTASPSGIIPGVVLIVVGTIFLLDHMGIIRSEHLWKFWPMAIVAVGLIKFIKEGDRPVGIALILVGGLVQLYKLGLVGLSWDTIWPFILIVAGASMIWSRFTLPKIPGMSKTLSGEERETLNEHALFGGVERRVSVNNFRGGMITAVFGGVEVDFRSAEIEGEEALVFVEAIFGGIEITVPDRWNVTFQGQSIFAGFTDETRVAALYLAA
jgi:predicted membrane protein